MRNFVQSCAKLHMKSEAVVNESSIVDRLVSGKFSLGKISIESFQSGVMPKLITETFGHFNRAASVIRM